MLRLELLQCYVDTLCGVFVLYKKFLFAFLLNKIGFELQNEMSDFIGENNYCGHNVNFSNCIP